jgi:predicted dehydrogenase
VVQTVGLGPHRLNRATRPGWFFDRGAYGGILTDIASHQIDQFLHFTGSEDAEITHAAVENYAHPGDPGLQDFGEIALRSEQGRGYIRVDWFTPDALPNWGDGRLTILGTEGYIELRKYVDVAGRAGTDTLILANGERCEAIDARDAGLPYFARVIADVQDRTETAMRQAIVFKVMELALRAQEWRRAGHDPGGDHRRGDRGGASVGYRALQGALRRGHAVRSEHRARHCRRGQRCGAADRVRHRRNSYG